MKPTEKDINEVHKALKHCRDRNPCPQCPYWPDPDCLEIIEHEITELYISEHPEIFNDRGVKI